MTVAELIAILQQVPDQNMQVAVADWDEREKGYLADRALAIYEEEWGDGITRLQIAPGNALNYEWCPDVIHYKPSPDRLMVTNGVPCVLHY